MLYFKTKRGFICVMDGVLYHGNKLLPGATEFIQWLQAYNKEYLFLTNNSGFTPRELHIKLLRMGIDVSEEHFYTSALATAEFIRSQNPKASAYVLGEAGLLNALYDAGIAIDDVNPDYVIVGESASYSLNTLTRATNLVLAGAKLIGANSDAQSVNDAHRPESAQLSQRRRRDCRGPYGHGYHLRTGKRYRYRSGAERDIFR